MISSDESDYAESKSIGLLPLYDHPALDNYPEYLEYILSEENLASKDQLFIKLHSNLTSSEEKLGILRSLEHSNDWLEKYNLNVVLSLLKNKNFSEYCIKILSNNSVLLSDLNFRFTNEDNAIITKYLEHAKFQADRLKLSPFLTDLSHYQDYQSESLLKLHDVIVRKFPSLHITIPYLSGLERNLLLISEELDPDFYDVFINIVINDMLHISDSPEEYKDFIQILITSETAIDDLMNLLSNGKIEKLSRIIEILEMNWLSSSLTISDDVKETLEFKDLIRLSHKVKENNLRSDTIYFILSRINDDNLSCFTNILRTIYEYKIDERSRNQNGDNIEDMLLKYQNAVLNDQLDKLETEIYSIAINQFASKTENKDADLLSKFYTLNPYFAHADYEILELLRKVHSHYNDIYNGHDLPVKDWTVEEVKEWASNFKFRFSQKKSGEESKVGELDLVNIAKIIAILQHANYLHTLETEGEGHLLRDTQILSLLLLLDQDIPNKGRLLQIATGEGKSTISAILAASFALLGQKVDVVTSSSVLANAGYNGASGFFDILGLTCGINTNSDNSVEQKACYLDDIVYGDALSFQSDFLSNTSGQGPMRGVREFSITIIDEVDSMLIDSRNHVAKQVSHIPLMEFLLPLLAIAWNNFHLSIVPLGLKREEMVSLSEAMITDIINNSPIPRHLIKYAEFQAQNWARNLVSAHMDFVLDKHYVINKNADGKKVIHPVDSATGVTQENMVWENGLHQFLQIKHGCVVSSESLTVFFITNISYFKKYSKILGITGTLGSESSQAFLKEIYNIDLGFIPTYKDKQLIELPGRIVSSEEDLYKAVSNKAYHEAVLHNRSVLVICNTIKDVNDLCMSLSIKCSGEAKIINYSRSEKDLYNSDIETLAYPRTIIVATNLAGRGTDIKTSLEVEENGGLHVISTFVAKNARDEAQVQGRTARQGNNGSYEVITAASLEEISSLKDDEEIIANKKANRDHIEHLFIRNAISDSVPKLLMQDQLYEEFSDLYLECLEHRSGSIMSWSREKQLIENFGLWLKLSKDMNIASIKDFIEQARFNYYNEHFTNSSYLTKYFASNSKIAVMLPIIDKATSVGDIYNFPAHYYRAKAWIDHKGESYKNNAIYSLQESVNRVSEIIPFLTSMQISVSSSSTIESELSEQISAKVQFLKSFIENIEKIVDVISKSGENEIRVSGLVGLQTVNSKLSKSDINEIVFLGIENFFEVESYKPKKDWSSTIFTACCSIAQMAIGALVVIGSLGGATTLGVGIFSEGLMDAYKVSMAISKGQPIKLQDYLTSKAISYAMIGTQIGISKMCESNTAVNATKMSNTAKDAAVMAEKMTVEELRSNAVKELVINSSIQLAKTVAIDYAASAVSKKIHENILDGLEEKINNAVYQHSKDRISKNNILFAQQANIERLKIQKDGEVCILNALKNNRSAVIINELSSRALSLGAGYNSLAKALSVGYEVGSKVDAISKINPIIENINFDLSGVIDRSARDSSSRLRTMSITYLTGELRVSALEGLSKSLAFVASKLIMHMIERKVTMPVVSSSIRYLSDSLMEDFQQKHNDLLSVYTGAIKEANCLPEKEPINMGRRPENLCEEEPNATNEKSANQGVVKKKLASKHHKSYVDFVKEGRVVAKGESASIDGLFQADEQESRGFLSKLYDESLENVRVQSSNEYLGLNGIEDRISNEKELAKGGFVGKEVAGAGALINIGFEECGKLYAKTLPRTKAVTDIMLRGVGEVMSTSVMVAKTVAIASSYEEAFQMSGGVLTREQWVDEVESASSRVNDIVLENTTPGQRTMAELGLGIFSGIATKPGKIGNTAKLSKTVDDFNIGLKSVGAFEYHASDILKGAVVDLPVTKKLADLHVWDMVDRTHRGIIIENHLGHNLPQTFPVIDKIVNNVVTNIKSIDLDLPTYQNPVTLKSILKKHVNKTVEFVRGDRVGERIEYGTHFTERALDLAIPHLGNSSQKEVLEYIVRYGNDNGVRVNLIVIERR